MRSDTDYIRNNEQKINRILWNSVLGLFLAGPFLMLVSRYGIGVMNFTLRECIILCVYDLLLALVTFLMLRSERCKRLTKYFLILGMHLGVCYVATKDGINIHIAYAMMPALSCLYFRKRFTWRIMGMSYIGMIASLYARAYMEVEFHYLGWGHMEWFGAYGFALTLEYMLLAAILYALLDTIVDSLTLLRRKNRQVYEMQRQLVIGFANVLESRDRGTGHHVQRTAMYVNMIANRLREMGHYTEELTDQYIDNITMAAPLHDAGKICVPDSILLKKGGLEDDEYEIMKSHTIEGHRLVSENLWNIADAKLAENIKNVVLYHHEAWDGSGYPMGLSGEAIPLEARITAVADSLDALLSKRAYKSRMKPIEALAIISKESGTHYEPCIVDAAISLMDKIDSYVNGEYLEELEEFVVSETTGHEEETTTVEDGAEASVTEERTDASVTEDGSDELLAEEVIQSAEMLR